VRRAAGCGAEGAAQAAADETHAPVADRVGQVQVAMVGADRRARSSRVDTLTPAAARAVRHAHTACGEAGAGGRARAVHQRAQAHHAHAYTARVEAVRPASSAAAMRSRSAALRPAGRDAAVRAAVGVAQRARSRQGGKDPNNRSMATSDACAQDPDAASDLRKRWS